jgi:hypothetical protein
MLLDRSLIENNNFVPQLEPEYLLQMVQVIAEILQGQAGHRQIRILLNMQCAEMCLLLDKMRI